MKEAREARGRRRPAAGKPKPAVAKLPSLPPRCGVYLFRDLAGEVLYVGKAKDLHARVRSYFRQGGDGRLASRFLERRIHDLEWIVTDTEKEALLLENNLIKERKPHYNVRLKDDKSFLSILIDPRDPFPRLQLVRRPRRSSASMFGPYASAKAVRDTIRLLHSILPLRDCKDAEFHNRSRPCIKHQIGRCSAPCVGLVDAERYGTWVREAKAILGGHRSEVVARLRRDMARAAEDLEFERAARLRDQIEALERTLERQKVEDLRGGERDVCGFHREGRLLEIGMLFVRRGAVMSFRSFSFESDLPDAEVLSGFLGQFYGGGREVPAEVLLPFPLEGREALEAWLGGLRPAGRVIVRIPRRGEAARLVRLARENARSSFSAKLRRSDRISNVLLSLQHRLGLPLVPRRIECFDISNVGGEIAVGAMVVFEDGDPCKDLWRRYRIRETPGPDDFGMLREVFRRRYRPGPDRGELPDLVVVDGGRGQLSSALEALAELGITTLDVIGLAKRRSRGPRGPLARRRELPERVFTASAERAHVLDPGSPEMRLLARIRDETHRFAIRFARESKRRKERTSSLEDVPGLGPVRARALLASFDGIPEMREASDEELRRAGRLPRSALRALRRWLGAPPGQSAESTGDGDGGGV